VRAFDANNNQVSETRTAGNGRYSFGDLAPGKYSLEISMPGFKSLRMNSVNVDAGRTNNYSNNLEVGAASMTVSVVAGGQQFMETQNTTIAGLPKGSVNIGFDGANGQDILMNSSDALFAVNDVEEFGIMSSSESAFKATGQSVTGAQGGLLGDLFEYKLKDRVTIRKNQSALVPIVQTEITAEKVALWNMGLGMARPLRALWLTNSSPLVLDGGSFNVIEDGAFAGEGLIASLHPNEKRLISYATDLAMQVVARHEGVPEKVTRIFVARGTMIRSVETRSRVSYIIRNEDTYARTLILEHPVRAGWKLAADLKSEEKSATAYRFRVAVPSKETVTFVVEETSPTSSSVSINDLNYNSLELFVNRKELTPELEQALREILAKKDAIVQLDADLKAKHADVDRIFHDQERLRENMQVLKGTAEEKALTQRYTNEMNDQENQLVATRKEIASLEAKRKLAQEELDATIEHLEFDVKM
jgi:hypothetical protein